MNVVSITKYGFTYKCRYANVGSTTWVDYLENIRYIAIGN